MRLIGLLIILLLVGCRQCNRISDPSNEATGKTGQPSPQPSIKSNQALFQESQALAADLSKAKSLQTTYQNLKAQVGIQAGKNAHPTFVGIQGMKDSLRKRNSAGDGDLNKFIAWAQAGDWEQFGPNFHHYDWWMFPIDRSSSGQGWQFTVYHEDIQALKADQAFLKDYRLGAILLIQSWGWDVKNKCSYAHPGQGQKWRNWDVRLGKLAHSLILFEQWDLYDSLEAYVKQLTQSNVQLESWVLSYFPSL
jgi:hypothetical protein